MANTFKFGNGNWAVKDGYALAYNDENNNFKPLPFDFTRASSATMVNKQGLVETVPSGKPRIDFLDNTSGHLLLEPSRTNIMTDSELSTTTATTTGNGASSDITLSNGLSGKQITITSSGRVFFYFTATVVSGSQYTVSAFVEDYTGNIASNFIDILSGGGGEDFSSNLIENGRIQGTFTATSTTVAIRLGFGTTSTFSGAYSAKISGIQLEAGSYATSYIPTSGSTATRSAETANNAGNSTVFNDSEGVLYAEIAALANDLTYRGISIGDGTASNVVRFYYENISNRFTANIKYAGISQATFIYTFTDITINSKIAVKYKQNDFALWVNGVEVGTDTLGSTPTGLDVLQFDTGTGGDDFYGKVKDLRVYNTALSDTELQQLTS